MSERTRGICPKTGRPYIIDERGRRRFTDARVIHNLVGLDPVKADDNSLASQVRPPLPAPKETTDE